MYPVALLDTKTAAINRPWQNPLDTIYMLSATASLKGEREKKKKKRGVRGWNNKRKGISFIFKLYGEWLAQIAHIKDTIT